MQDILDRHEAEIEEVKQALKKRRHVTNQYITDLNDLLDENGKKDSEEKQDAVTAQPAVPV